MSSPPDIFPEVKVPMKALASRFVIRLLSLMLCASVAFAQSNAQGRAGAEFSQQELDQMLAPIALYPDPLLSQILMASTYPIEVVEAARWSKAHPGSRGDQAVRSVQDQDWDPSVKSLVAFPQVLAMMDQNLEWTQRLGDAFLAQEPLVMDTVQNLRRRAYAEGNLRSSDRVRVAQQGQTIVVEPASPQVVYVPYYDPWVVYGPWWWPAYPPVYWRPWPGYYAGPGVSIGFFWGAPVAVSAGFFFGAFDWPRRTVQVVHVNNYYYGNTVNVTRQTTVFNRQTNATATPAPGTWKHDPDHRRGVAYRGESVRQQFVQPHGRPSAAQTAEIRRDARPADRALPPQQRAAPAPREAQPGGARPGRRDEERSPATGGALAAPRFDHRREGPPAASSAPAPQLRAAPQPRAVPAPAPVPPAAPLARSGGRHERDFSPPAGRGAEMRGDGSRRAEGRHEDRGPRDASKPEKGNPHHGKGRD